MPGVLIPDSFAVLWYCPAHIRMTRLETGLAGQPVSLGSEGCGVCRADPVRLCAVDAAAA